MLLAFDLDGVLAQANIPIFRLADMIGGLINKDKQEEIYKWAFKTAKPLLDPGLFLEGDDEYIIITARPREYEDITRKWTERFTSNCKETIIVDMPFLEEETGEKVFEWLNEVARRKAEIINSKKVDIYFDDSSYAVKQLRKLCPDTKIVNYGGRI